MKLVKEGPETPKNDGPETSPKKGLQIAKRPNVEEETKVEEVSKVEEVTKVEEVPKTDKPKKGKIKKKPGAKGSGFFKMSKEKSAWGLDIGDNEISATKVSLQGGQVFVEKFERIEYSTIKQDITSDKSDIVKKAISLFKVRNNISETDKVVTSIPGKMVLLRFVSLPPMKRSQIPSVIRFELRKQIPFDPSEIIWDSYQFGEKVTTKKGAEVGIFATKKENISYLLPHLELLRMNLQAIQATPVAIYNLIRAITDMDEDIIIVNVEKGGTDFIVVGKSKFWNRSISISEINTDLVREIQRSMGYYISLTKDAKPGNIFLMGEAFDEDKINFIKGELDGNVALLNLQDKMKFSKNIDESMKNERTVHSFGVTIGLALQGIDHGKVDINLLPYDYIRERLAPKRKKMAIAITILLALGLLTQGYRDVKATSGISAYIDKIKTKAGEVRRYARTYKKIEDEIKVEEESLESLKAIGNQSNFWVSTIHNIIDVLPENVYLVDINSSWGQPYAEKEEGPDSKKSPKKKTKKPTKVLIMSIMGESYDPSVSYIKENVKKPLENLKLFGQQTPAFRNVEIVQGSIRTVIDTDLGSGQTKIAFQIRWIVDKIN